MQLQAMIARACAGLVLRDDGGRKAPGSLDCSEGTGFEASPVAGCSAVPRSDSLDRPSRLPASEAPASKLEAQAKRTRAAAGAAGEGATLTESAGSLGQGQECAAVLAGIAALLVDRRQST